MNMTGNNKLWALAPQYATGVFASIREELAQPREENPDIGAMITRRENSCAIISVRGALDQHTVISRYSSKIWFLGYDAIRQAITAALVDPLVKTILLSLDSPGGIVAGAKETADFIAEAAKVKPVAAYADGLCASAAFWLASATGRIYAPATSLVGSVGVIMCVADWSGAYEKMGLRLEYITSGKYKAAGADGKELADDERKYFEEQMAEIHAIFKADVSARLGITAEEALWAEAQLMPASVAKNLGLVTRIVRDEAEAVNLLAGKSATEQIMSITREYLQKEAPELLAEIEEEALVKAQAKAGGETLALVKAIAGEETAAKLESVLKAGITAEQLEALAPVFQSKAAEHSEAEKRDQMLKAITQATGGPENSNPQGKAKSSLVANAEARAMRG